MPEEFETVGAQQMPDVLLATGEEIIHAQHFATLLNQPVAQMRAEKAGAPGYQDGLVHCSAFGARYVRNRYAAACPRNELMTTCGGGQLTKLLSLVTAMFSLMDALGSLLLLCGASVTLPLSYAPCGDVGAVPDSAYAARRRRA
jgi:hypothetical protein